MNNEPIVLVVEPADAETMAAGTSFDRFCEVCKGRVMIAPTGQKLLRDRPDDVHIVCIRCVPPDAFAQASLNPFADKQELANEISNPVPNMRRHRN